LNIVQQEVAEIITGEEVHTVRLVNGQEHRAAALILAAGSSVRKLGIPGEAEYFGSGVSYCANCDGFFFKGKDVIVVGGGDTAVEEALYLARLVRRVRLVHRGDTLRAGRMLQDRLQAKGNIEVLWNRRVAEIRGNSRVVESAVLEDVVTGKRVETPTDGVFIFIGNYPNNKLVPPPVRMNERGFVITDEKCATNVPGIFAAGDLRQKFANQIVVAAADGCIAALAAAHYVENRKAAVP
jgi:thioredoxin reductase (NADPH)